MQECPVQVNCSREMKLFSSTDIMRLLSLYKKNQTNLKGYANMRVPVKVLRLLQKYM